MISSNRNYSSLIEEYKKVFLKRGYRGRGQIFLSDYENIKALAEERASNKSASNLAFYYIEIALEAGIVIGYKARIEEEKDERRKQKTAAAAADHPG